MVRVTIPFYSQSIFPSSVCSSSYLVPGLDFDLIFGLRSYLGISVGAVGLVLLHSSVGKGYWSLGKHSRRSFPATMSDSKRDEQNAKRRKAYAEMDAETKENLLMKPQVQYALSRASNRKPVLSSVTIGHGSTSTEIGESSHTHSATAVPVGLTVDCARVSEASGTSSFRRRSPAEVDQSLYPKRVHANRRPLPSPIEDNSASSSSQRNYTLLPPASDCQYCAAKKFYHEPPSFCCYEGEIRLVREAIIILIYSNSWKNLKKMV